MEGEGKGRERRGRKGTGGTGPPFHKFLQVTVKTALIKVGLVRNVESIFANEQSTELI